MSLEKFEVGQVVKATMTNGIFEIKSVSKYGRVAQAVSRYDMDEVQLLNPQFFTLLSEEKQEPIGKKLFGHKMRVTPETSRLVQEAVFEAGGGWWTEGKKVKYLDMECLYISKGGRIAHSDYDGIFKDAPSPEIQVSAKSVLVIEDIVKSEKELQIEETLRKIASLEEQLKQLKESLEETNND